MTWPFGNLPMLGCDVVIADPPTPFDLYSDEGEEKSAAAHYKTMDWADLAMFPVSQLARGDCLLMLWATEPARPRSEWLMRQWGFTYKSAMIWRKVTKNGKVRMGTGYRVRTMHEPILIGTIGNPVHKPFPSIFDGVAREHSRKPDEFYQIVQKHTPKAINRVDLFSRETRTGFIGWGDQHGKFDQPEAA